MLQLLILDLKVQGLKEKEVIKKRVKPYEEGCNSSGLRGVCIGVDRGVAILGNCEDSFSDSICLLERAEVSDMVKWTN